MQRAFNGKLLPSGERAGAESSQGPGLVVDPIRPEDVLAGQYTRN